MGTRKRLTRELVRQWLALPFVLREIVPCSLCEVPIPLAALRDGHGLAEWCGVAERRCAEHGNLVLCPDCVDELLILLHGRQQAA